MALPVFRPHDFEPVATSPSDAELDEFIELYVYWREECVAVWETYARWRASPASDSTAAFDAYCDALDREELAAAAYQEIAREIAEAVGLGSPVEVIRAGLG